VAFSGGEIAAGNVVQVVYSATQGNFHTIIPPSGTPTRTVFEYAGTTAPVGYLMAKRAGCQSNGYAKLFAAIGTTFGVGDGSTTFNLPDKRGAYPLERMAAPGASPISRPWRTSAASAASSSIR
jgi:hypothetical protein